MVKLISFIFILLENTLKFLFEFIETAISAIPKRNEGYTANFISHRTLLSSKHTGFCLTGKNNLSVKDSYQNALVVGGTGVGKSSVTLLPSIFTMQGSFVIHDPSGELKNSSSGMLLQNGYDIRVLNFSRPEVSSGYNPLTRANTSSEISKMASMLVLNAMGGGKDPFWNTQATSLLSMLISILKKQEPQYQNLYNVRQLLNSLGSNPEGVDSLFSRFANSTLFAEYKSFISFDEKVVSGVIATCKAALQIFSDENVAKVTSFDTLELSDFRRKPTALFIQNSVSDQKYYSVLTSIFFEQFFAYIMSCFPSNGEQDIFFLIDEASSLKLPTLQLAVANCRKHKSGIMAVVQSYTQLENTYGKHEADAIRANCFAKLYYTGQSLETARELESILGKFEYKDEAGKKVVRPLMTSDEIRIMETKHALLICGHHKPIFAKLYPYYTQRSLLKLSQIPAPEIYSNIPYDSVPVLPLPNPEESR